MNVKSIKVSQWIFLFCVVMLVLLGLFDHYFSRVQYTADSRYHSIMQLQKAFGDILTIERMALDSSKRSGMMRDHCLQLCDDIGAEELLMRPELLAQRQELFNELFSVLDDNSHKYDSVKLFLPEMIESVRYIHGHHIAYLQNLLRHGVGVHEFDVESGFQRSPGSAAPELEIIAATISIQNSLLDVFTIFYELQKGDNPSELNKKFRKRIDHFHAQVNIYEDYSLDAQDGLLVEELLLTGKRFTDAFSTLLKNESHIDLLEEQLQQNQESVGEMFELALVKIEQGNRRLLNRLDLLRTITLVVSVLLAVWLVYYGWRIVQGFARTVNETRKIQADLTYHIPYEKKEFREFRVIYQALNSMAETANERLGALEKVQSELSMRVRERTAELVNINTQLSNEITDRIIADEARKDLESKLIRAKKMEAVGTLAGGVAHDLNNILSGIVSYPDLIMLDLEEDHPFYSSIATIKKSGEKAAAIVQDLLTLARRGVQVSEVVDMQQLVREYLESPAFLQLHRAHPDISLRCRLDPDTGIIKGSRLHLQKTLMNLVANAVDAMPDGGVLTLTTANTYIDTALKGYDTVREGDYVRLSVADTGVGMSAEICEQVFEPFFIQKKMGQSGTGLGMAVVWGTVKDHGGYIDIDTQPGKGTAFSLYFSMTREVIGEVSGRVDFDEITGRGEFVLVVDDVYEQREIAKRMLTRLGYSVATVSSGEEAVAYIEDYDVDLIVLDMIMTPGMDGFETYRAITAIRPGIRAIITSGYSESESVQKTQELGAGVYVRKPYLLEAIGKAVWNELFMRR